MKIFITGLAGFLGSHLADKFLADGHEVLGCDNFLLGDVVNVPNGANCIMMDCRDMVNHSDVLSGVDVLYHCAATAHEGLSVFSPSFITKNIYEASVSVFSAAIQAGVKRIVYCSSMARYGEGYGVHHIDLETREIHMQAPPFEEFFKTIPVDPYGIAKVAAEQTLKSLASVHGIEYVIAVPHNIIGVRQNYTDPFRNVASIMINRMKQGKQPIIYGDGRQTRCFSPIGDVVDIMARFATEEGISGQVFNVGPDDDEISIMKLANKIAAILNFEIMPIFLPDRPLEVKHAVCSSDKIRKQFGYERIQSLDDCLKEMCDSIEPKPFNYDNLPLEIVSDKTPQSWSRRLM